MSQMGMSVTVYITTLQHANRILEQHLLQGLIPSQLGLDLEWKPTYVKNTPENPVALLQLASESNIYLFHLSRIRAFPERLRFVLENPYILKTGVGIQGDVRKLYNDWGVSVVSCVDLSLLARSVDSILFAERLGRYAGVGDLLVPPPPPTASSSTQSAESAEASSAASGQQSTETSESQPNDAEEPEPFDPYAPRLFRGRFKDPIGLARFMRIFHDVELDKGKITRSNWEKFPLSPPQIDCEPPFTLYLTQRIIAFQDAAKDAHASYLIYNDLVESLRLIPAEKYPKWKYFSFDCIDGQLYQPYKPELRDILAIPPESPSRPFTVAQAEIYLRGIGEPRSDDAQGLVLWSIENPEYEPAHPPAKPKKEKDKAKEDGEKKGRKRPRNGDASRGGRNSQRGRGSGEVSESSRTDPSTGPEPPRRPPRGHTREFRLSTRLLQPAMPVHHSEDEFDQMEDEFDYGAIAEDEWDTLQTQANYPPSSTSNTIAPSTSTISTANTRNSMALFLDDSDDTEATGPLTIGNRDRNVAEEGEHTRSSSRGSHIIQHPAHLSDSSNSSYSSELGAYLTSYSSESGQITGEDEDELEAPAETLPEAGPSTLAPPTLLSRRSSDSSYYGDSSDYDETFLEQLDAVERRIVEQETPGYASVPPPPSDLTILVYVSLSSRLPCATYVILLAYMSPTRNAAPIPAQTEQIEFDEEPVDRMARSNHSSSPRGISKRRRSSDRDDHSPKKKGKSRDDSPNFSIIANMLAEYEDEVNCPVCCDYIVGAHVFNPCGHTLCGNCGWEWAVKNRKSTCPVCRTRCDIYKPMLPNILVDNIVQRYVGHLAMVDPAWATGGLKWVEWNARLQNWKMVSTLRSKAMTYHRAVVKHADHEFGVDPDLVDGVAGRVQTLYPRYLQL
ncbi:hypothetical protein VNI00_001938 [Paramarasmius palmivorus]|uniref:RING-type domain-containing protein n=1 Tax=Paramarasmius palmivorus TaxID=297713 RepID=A0AAW0E3J2_9AGAR